MRKRYAEPIEAGGHRGDCGVYVWDSARGSRVVFGETCRDGEFLDVSLSERMESNRGSRGRFDRLSKDCLE
jgi:hypothetical protein